LCIWKNTEGKTVYASELGEVKYQEVMYHFKKVMEFIVDGAWSQRLCVHKVASLSEIIAILFFSQ
jgi:hypothetical protein